MFLAEQSRYAVASGAVGIEREQIFIIVLAVILGLLVHLIWGRKKG